MNDIQKLLEEARAIWGDQKMTKEQIVIALGVVYGDMCRTIRDAN